MIRIFKGEVQRLFPILEAIKEGKTIQFHLPDGWRDIDGDDEGFYLETLIGESDKYRIKPEPKYRSFKNAEECLDEMLKHQPFGWIKTKEGGFLISYLLMTIMQAWQIRMVAPFCCLQKIAIKTTPFMMEHLSVLKWRNRL